jgi:uncharacterized membrane protein YozB (DUF420 family)
LLGLGKAEWYMGLFNPYAVFLSDVNLLFQLAVLFVLIASVFFKVRQNYSKHGITMGIAVILHTVSIFFIMVPSLKSLSTSFENLLSPLTLAVLSHSVLGSFVELLGIYLIVAWISRRGDVKVCFKNRKAMKPTLALWLIELAVGIYVYILLYAPFWP